MVHILYTTKHSYFLMYKRHYIKNNKCNIVLLLIDFIGPVHAPLIELKTLGID